MKRNLLGLIGSLTTWKITEFAVDSEGMENWEDDRGEESVENGANAVSSLRTDSGWLSTALNPVRTHAVLLDLDVPAYLVPSSTPGHSHLYIDVQCREEDYFALLDALVRCRVIESGYARASKKKGGTFLRLPWVKKGGSLL